MRWPRGPGSVRPDRHRNAGSGFAVAVHQADAGREVPVSGNPLRRKAWVAIITPDLAPAAGRPVGRVRLPGSRRPWEQPGRGWLDKAGLQGDPGELGAAAAPGLVPDPVQAGPDCADADGQVVGDLGVGAALGDQGDQFPFPGAELAHPPPQARS